MVLHGEHGKLDVPQALARVVVEVAMGGLPAAPGKRGRIDGEAVILGRDLHLVGGQVLHRVIRAVMTERQLVRTAAGGQAENLVSETDAKHRHAADQAAHGLDEVRNAFGIAGPVREKHAVGLALEYRLRRRGGRHPRVHAAGRPQQPPTEKRPGGGAR